MEKILMVSIAAYKYLFDIISFYVKQTLIVVSVNDWIASRFSERSVA